MGHVCICEDNILFPASESVIRAVQNFTKNRLYNIILFLYINKTVYVNTKYNI